MKYDSEKIIEICKSEVEFFENPSTVFGQYEPKGIFNSEMLLFCAISKHLGVKHLIESGRARAQSTSIMARFFCEDQYKITSLELNRYTADTIVALNRLSLFKNCELFYGDAFKELPGLVKTDCTVLIDGPKGKWAVLLASLVLENPNVKAVFIHDTHKDSDCRELIETLYTDTFFTDDLRFVKEFEPIDVECWKGQSQWKQFKDWGPYCRGVQKMKSYSATLGMIINSKNGIKKHEECQNRILEEGQETFYSKKDYVRNFLGALKDRVMTGVVTPYWVIRYHGQKVLGAQRNAH